MVHRQPQGTEVLLAEYASLREESAQARQAQQSTLQWSLAGVAALLAAALVFATATVKNGPTPTETGVLIGLFGFAVPGYAFAASLIYAGEIGRMERAGAYLRALEADLERVEGYASLRWERYLRAGDGTRGAMKLNGPYLGGGGLYVGTVIVAGVADLAFAAPQGYGVLAIVVGVVGLLTVGIPLAVSFSSVRRSRAPNLAGVSAAWNHREAKKRG